MTKKGKLISIRHTLSHLECLQEKFMKDDTSGFIDGEIRKLKIIKEKLENEIKAENLDYLRRREKT